MDRESPTQIPSPTQGTLLAGRYEVLERLGGGGMGEVVSAVDHVLDGEVVALKMLYPQLVQDSAILARFRNEVVVSRRLSHPNIVSIYDFGTLGNGLYFISMEYVRGQNLGQRIYDDNRESIAFDDIIFILKKVACGLGHAHKRGVIHRDLKPDNILLSESREVKITDLGLARTLSVDKGFTQTGETVGTPYYMAPEQIQGARLDHRC